MSETDEESMKKKVLFLGASGLIGPFLTSGLEEDYDLYLADVKPHPDGTSIASVDITSYEQVHEAARGMGYSPQHDFARHWSV